MDIAIVPGWPFQPPAVLGPGAQHEPLDARWSRVHVARGRCNPAVGLPWMACMTGSRSGADRREAAGKTMTWDRTRLLNFRRKDRLPGDLRLRGTSARALGGGVTFTPRSASHPRGLNSCPGAHQVRGSLRGLWFRLVGVWRTPPPRRLSEVSTCLSTEATQGAGARAP